MDVPLKYIEESCIYDNFKTSVLLANYIFQIKYKVGGWCYNVDKDMLFALAILIISLLLVTLRKYIHFT